MNYIYQSHNVTIALTIEAKKVTMLLKKKNKGSFDFIYEGM